MFYFAWNKKMEKLPIFHQNHGLFPLEICPFFDFFYFLFFIVEEGAFFV